MKTTCLTLSIALLLTASAASAQSPSLKQFDALKSLAGDWQGKDNTGREVHVTFRVVSGGSAVMSEIKAPDPQDAMVSIFHLDRDRLLMTHYCGAGNQPRMKAVPSPGAEQIAFDFLDITNLKSDKTGHMQWLVLSLPDADHHSETWSFLENGKTTTETFHLQRAKI